MMTIPYFDEMNDHNCADSRPRGSGYIIIYHRPDTPYRNSYLEELTADKMSGYNFNGAVSAGRI